MGIRKGWALCGAGERRCFISHAVSSHPLLELQTPGLLALSSAHHQDLPLDSIQKKEREREKKPSSLFPSAPYLSFFHLFFPFFPLLPPSPATSDPAANRKTGTLLASTSICLTFFLRTRWEIPEVFMVVKGAHLFFPPPPFFLFLFLLSLSLLKKFPSCPSWLPLCGYLS